MKILRCILSLRKGQKDQFNQQNSNRSPYNQVQLTEQMGKYDCNHCQEFDYIKYVEYKDNCINLICQNCRNLRTNVNILHVVHLQKRIIGVFRHFAYVLDQMNFQLQHIDRQSKEDVLLVISKNINLKSQTLLFCLINYEKIQQIIDDLSYRHELLQRLQELDRYMSIKEASIQIEQFIDLVNTTLKINNLQIAFNLVTSNRVKVQLVYLRNIFQSILYNIFIEFIYINIFFNIQMNQICQSCENLSQIKYILYEEQKIKLLCLGHRSQLVNIPHLESIFRENNVISILPYFQNKISQFHSELQASLKQFIKNTGLIKIQLQERLKQFDDLRKEIFNLDILYKDEQARSSEVEQLISNILTRFSICFKIEKAKAFRMMSKIEPFDNSISFKLKNLLFDIL